MSPESIPAMEPQPARMGEFSRLTGVLFDPKKTFEDIAQRPGFWVPLIVLTLAAVIFTYLLSVHVGWDTVVRQQMQTNASAQQRLEQLPPDQRERAESMGRTMAPIMGYASAVLGRLIGFLIAAGILLGIVRGIMSAPVKFKQVFAVLWYAAMPALLQTVLAGVVMFLKKPEEFNLMNPLAFNPAAFMDPTSSSKFVYAIARSLDVFTIWMLILVAVGLKAAGGKKLSFGGALTAVVAPWALLVLGGASIAGMFG